uniref:Uncharacterized protein n=1 Tax=Caudovirales sp. gcode 4 TaxID=2838363 RepID=A0A8S5RT67_9CAUD|nr:MAG TPA: hypothetical protein [Caudovirales sp. gcode 4]
MQELEKILNSMIKRWWKPWNKEYTTIDVIQDGREECLMFRNVPKRQMQAYIFRSLVSIESGFWQFVCQNKLLSDKVDLQDYLEDSYWFRRCPFDTNWMYRIMQSALYSEEDLEKFLVENIKVD